MLEFITNVFLRKDYLSLQSFNPIIQSIRSIYEIIYCRNSRHAVIGHQPSFMEPIKCKILRKMIKRIPTHRKSIWHPARPGETVWDSVIARISTVYDRICTSDNPKSHQPTIIIHITLKHRRSSLSLDHTI
jgi:hypothetical protein